MMILTLLEIFLGETRKNPSYKILKTNPMIGITEMPTSLTHTMNMDIVAKTLQNLT
jgi:hypothetical protein